jgi:lysophospholipase-3
VILVPGDGGSQFEAILNKPKVVHIWCSKQTSSWFSLWLNLELLAPYVLDCFVDNMRLKYDPKTRTTLNNDGVETRQPGFGNTTTVEWLDPSQLGPTSYFNQIANSLVSWGYERNVNIKGAPYDFRKAPNEMQGFINDLKNLIETTSKENSNLPVVLLAHSMGNPYVLYLLNHQSQSWKDKYVRSVISMSGPWGGAVKTIRLMASGDNLGVFVVNPLSARPQQRSMPSTAWLMPYDTFWNDTEVLVQSPTRNYTVKDYKQFFEDIKFQDGYEMRKDTENLTKDLKAPGVEVHCIHGINVKTPGSFKYSVSQWFNDQPEVIWDQGDGTVNIRSLRGCLRWQSQQKAKVHYQTFDKVDHMQILDHNDVLNYLKQTLTTINNES